LRRGALLTYDGCTGAMTCPGKRAARTITQVAYQGSVSLRRMVLGQAG